MKIEALGEPFEPGEAIETDQVVPGYIVEESGGCQLADVGMGAAVELRATATEVAQPLSTLDRIAAYSVRSQAARTSVPRPPIRLRQAPGVSERARGGTPPSVLRRHS